MITFLLGWCVVSVIGTLIAVGLIKAGKTRQPEADDVSSNAPVPVRVSASYKR